MAKDSSENLYNILLDIREDIGVLKSKSSEHDLKFDQLIAQTTKTNGRVTKLEDITVSLNKTSETLTAMYSKQNGVYEQNLLEIKDKITCGNREIDELKKKVNLLSGEELDIKKISTEYTGKIKLQVIAGIISLLTIIATAFISYKVGENRVDDYLSTTNNIIK